MAQIKFKQDIEKYDIDNKTGCWNGKYSCDPDGYPHFKRNGKYLKLATYFYTKYKNEIPKGLQLDHLCRNRKCINPEHLEEVTGAENVRRGDCAKLNWEKVGKIRNLYTNKMFNQNQLGKLFGVGQDEISRIVNFKRWALNNI